MDNTHQIFKQASQESLPEGLRDQVFARIGQAMTKRIRTERYAWGAFTALSLAGLTLSGAYALRTLAASGFGSYFSLIFSDAGSVSLWWKELGLSLVESLPILGIGLVLASLGAVLLSIRRLSRSQPHSIITASRASIA